MHYLTVTDINIHILYSTLKGHIEGLPLHHQQLVGKLDLSCNSGRLHMSTLDANQKRCEFIKVMLCKAFILITHSPTRRLGYGNT